MADTWGNDSHTEVSRHLHGLQRKSGVLYLVVLKVWHPTALTVHPVATK